MTDDGDASQGSEPDASGSGPVVTGAAWYPQRTPPSRGARERFGALFALVVILGGIGLSITRTGREVKTATRMSLVYFATPDRGITCVFAMVPATEPLSSVSCGARNVSGEKPGSKRCDPGAFGIATLARDGTVTMECSPSGLPAGKAITLTDGESLESGRFRCSAGELGVTCINTEGEGFLMSRTSVVELTPS